MDNIVQLDSLRKEKENQLISFINQHVNLIEDYVDRHVNIREKVKAKHIFSGKIGSETIPVFSYLQEQLFIDWFTYDYLTIRGMTIYQSFVTQKSNNRHPLDPVVNALFMASVLEPFKVIKTAETHIYAEKLLSGEQCRIKLNSNKIAPYQNQVLFLRTIPVFDQLICISDMFIQLEKEPILNLLTHFENSTEGWRTFLKKFAIKYCWSN